MAPSYRHIYEAEEYKTQLSKVSECNVAWLAGWLCADGSISYYRTPDVRIMVSDRDPVERFVELFGGRFYGPYKQHRPLAAPNPKPLYAWIITGVKAVYLLERCMPWLSLRYQERAKQAMGYKHMPAKSDFTFTDIETVREAIIEANGKYGTVTKLARQYGISVHMVRKIEHGWTGREPTGPKIRDLFKAMARPGYFDNPNNFHPDELMNL